MTRDREILWAPDAERAAAADVTAYLSWLSGHRRDDR
jgi:hypothetical protein